MRLEILIAGLTLGIAILMVLGCLALGGGTVVRNLWLYLNLVADLIWRRVGDWFNALWRKRNEN